MAGILRHFESFRRDGSGSVATEIAVATPFLVFLTAGIVEYGSMLRSTELIYCWDPDGPSDPRGFARADHCDHIHVGWDA